MKTTKGGRTASLTKAERLLVDLEQAGGTLHFYSDLVLTGRSPEAYSLARLEMVALPGCGIYKLAVLTPKGRAAAQRLHVVEIH